VTDADLASASCIVTFGCDLAVAPTTRVERWDDVPAVSDDYRRARAAIDARLVRLVEDLAGRAPVKPSDDATEAGIIAPLRMLPGWRTSGAG
jgi:hypothetical protein